MAKPPPPRSRTGAPTRPGTAAGGRRPPRRQGSRDDGDASSETERKAPRGAPARGPAKPGQRATLRRAEAPKGEERPNGSRGNRSRDDRPRDDRSRDDRPRDDRPRRGGGRDERTSLDRPRSERPHKERPRSERPERETVRRGSAPAEAPSRARPFRAATLESPREDGLHRIAKLLARAGVASRRDIERMIADGRIALNGTLVETPATLLASLDGVTVDGKTVGAPEAARLFLFHKPSGVLTAARDPEGRHTIYDVLPQGLPRVMPVGRLDLNTEGLLLLTSDGGLKRKLELPSSGVERTYRARTFGPISQTQLEELAEGITVDGMRYGRIDANLERSTGRNQWIELTLTEGKNREVRRVLEHLGLQVSRLIRTRYGPFVLGGSAPGAVEEVSDREMEKLLNSLP